MDLIDRGVELGSVWISEDKKRVRYAHSDKGFTLSRPEEQVRIEVFLKLQFIYGYPIELIGIDVLIPGRRKDFKADIVIFNDEEKSQPYILIQCKGRSVTEAEFVQSVEQGFDYAASLAAQYLWTTTGDKSKAYKLKGFSFLEREKNLIADIPRFGQSDLSRAKFYKGGIDEQQRQAFDLEEVGQDRLTKIFKKAHQALWGGGKRNPSEAFDELDKLIFCKLWDEKKIRFQANHMISKNLLVKHRRVCEIEWFRYIAKGKSAIQAFLQMDCDYPLQS